MRQTACGEVLEVSCFHFSDELSTPIGSFDISLAGLNIVHEKTLLVVATEIRTLAQVLSIYLKCSSSIAIAEPINKLLDKLCLLLLRNAASIDKLLELEIGFKN